MKYIKSFSECDSNLNLLGGKGSNLVKLYKTKFNVPPGFILTTKAFKTFMKKSTYQKELEKYISKKIQPKEVLSISKNIQKMILDSEIPTDIEREIEYTYTKLKNNSHNSIRFAVRSSATIEDSDIASFAGQADTFLSRKTFQQILISIKKCWASLYSPHALLYLKQLKKMGKKISLDQIFMAVIVQKMIHSDISGVIFTTNVLNNNHDQMLINSVLGLGEGLANNIVIPDTIIIDKESCEIIRQIIGKKEKTVIPDLDNACTKAVTTDIPSTNQLCISNNHIKKLHQIGLDIEKKYKCPQDIEWAIKNDELYVLQTRPITTLK